jgi:glycosyltransferase involved in cell wall biosynthesis
MKILFISSLNLATNPRFVKEIKLALANGFSADVICFEFNNWSNAFNQQIKKDIGHANIYSIPAGRKPFLPWAISVFWEKCYRLAGFLFPMPLSLQSKGVSRRSGLLVKQIKKLKQQQYNWVIGHNPGALYPVYFGAKKFNAQAAFDVEDYHPGEGNNPGEQRLTKLLMNELLPKLDYVSFASPLMKKKHIEDCGKEGKNWTVVLNFFAADDFKKLPTGTNNNDLLKLVWFSQNINYKRGLEQVIPALDAYKDKIELTLIGNMKEEFYKEYVAPRPHIKIIPPQEQKALHHLMGNFDIGLAIEPGKDKNNFIALANKLITYFQSGLYILASDTPAHIDFLKTFPQHGMAVNLEKENVPSALNKLLLSAKEIQENKKTRKAASAAFSWETESEKLLQLWKNTSA